MAGTIIADYIRTDANKLSLNVGNTVVASINASGILSNTGNVMISSAGAITANNISLGRIVTPSVMPTGSILQVLQTTLTSATSYSVASGATQAITGLSVSITPSSSTSKIMVFASVNISCQNVGGAIYLLRGSTPIGVGDAAGSRTSVSSGSDAATQSLYSETQNPTIQFLDSPATTSSTTYSISLLNTRASTDTMYVNRSITDTSASNFGRYMSSITVMEIAA